jgi:hypothetical protein
LHVHDEEEDTYYVWPAPMDHPSTARACLMPRCLVTSSCCARTLSYIRMSGKGRTSGMFDGDEDWPLPNSAGMMM